MDLSVTQRLLHPGLDSAMLAPGPPFFLGPLTSQHCSQFSQQHLQYNIEQRQMEQEKREELQQLTRKSKNEQSAVASPLVRQKLREHIIMKSQPTHDRVTPNHNSPTPGYRLPVPDMSPNSQPTACDQRKDLALRRTVSEPTLKWKLKKLISTRPNPLQRKISAPPAVKHRTETLDSSPSSSSSNPASGCSSPNDSLHSDNGHLPLAHEAQRLLAHFTLPCNPTAMPNITAGLPAHADLRVARPLAVPALHQVYLPLEGCNPALDQHLQPVLILEPHTGLVHSQLVSFHGLSSTPLLQQQQQQPHLSSPTRREGVVTFPSHRPLERTRSEPPPYSHSPLTLHASRHSHIHHHLSQQYHKSGLERFKQNAHMSKLTSKSIEKPRLTQIPSEDMDLEEIGSGSGSGPGSVCDSESGSMCEDGYHRRQSTASTDSVYDTESTTSSRDSLIESSHSLSQRQVNLRSGLQLDPLGVPALIWPHQPLVRTQSSPASTSLPPPPHPPTAIPTLSLSSPAADVQLRFTTGLVYDAQMQKHQCTCGDNSRHPEHAGRVQSIWSRLHERGLRNQCERIRSRKATLEELQSVHSEKHVLLFGTNPLNRLKLDNRKLAGILSQRLFVMLPCGGVGVDIDTIWNELHTSVASRIAAGCVTDLALKVAQGELKNGFAVVRPPGHHANHSSPLGFCFFNSVAIAAKQLQHKLNVSKILIVDWDVHHGNGTQEAFYNDPSVLYISLHRYDDGNFFPGSGHPSEVGAGAGEGFNVNVGWTGGLNPPMGDAEYLAAFRAVVMPIAHEFSPDVVLVSAGFDAVEGHVSSLGGYKVTAKCFGFLTRQLMSLAGGRVVLALEGGHDLKAICDASESCVSALLGMEVEPLSQSVLDQKPCENAVQSLQRVIQVQGEYWQSVKDSAATVDLTYLQAQRRRLRRDSDSEAVSAIASLSMGAIASDKKQTRPEKLTEKGDSL
ncbi:histone deacetylase 7-like [Sander lucioperca]|uniref:Histone deacetylase n=1 Tax=Sander lucioperca TaxID=283035 RepID=A0A8C9WV95_SANLU|nr:histone deacetylase 7-like [Sander lucioperca]XP_031180011.1 histone deacetylase 7-like [Sander lucioperca]XP_031180019.1 histone deacetylase 7-like [Sander lucioperca]XP_031180026.1 histone deacetylase 7-like [Sander lucioperca]XP_031180035.1 histone deacetylase 7-like [Sander lucioperca]